MKYLHNNCIPISSRDHAVTDMELANELICRNEYVSSLHSRGTNLFGLFDGDNWKVLDAEEVFVNTIKKAHKRLSCCSLETLKNAIWIASLILPECDLNYPKEAREEVKKFVEDILIKDEDSTLKLGCRTPFNNLEYVSELQEFAKGGVFQAYLAWHVMGEFKEDIRNPLHRKCFDETLNKYLLEVYNVTRNEEDIEEKVVRGFKLNFETKPFKLSKQERKTIENNLSYVFGTRELL